MNDPKVTLSNPPEANFVAWWGEKPLPLKPLNPRSQKDTLSAWVWLAWQAATIAAAKDHAILCRKEGLYFGMLGQKNTRDFEICALLIEKSCAKAPPNKKE